MSVLRQSNLLGQQRIDVPHIRAIESSICADFDLLAGRVMAGMNAMIVSGFELITTGAVGAAATSLGIITASGVLLHPEASESGTIFSVPAERATEVLGSSNARIEGSFTANATNYIGIDLRRSADSTTSDVVQFLDPNTDIETPKSVPLGRTLDYVIIISTQDFSSTPGVAPIAKVVTDANNLVFSIEDARQKLFRLGSGGGVPDVYNAYPWPGGRSESLTNDSFTDGDKLINSMKDWVDAIMTRLWEIGGGENWYASTADRNVKMVRSGATFTNGDWFEWDGTNLHWKGLKFVFENSTAHYNDVANRTTNSAGLTDLADGECIYVDIDRTLDRTGGTALVAAKAVLNTLGTPLVPGTRYVLAWRVGTTIFTRDSSFPVGATFNVATNTSLGIVQLTVAAANPAIPLVVPVDANGTLKNTATSNTFHGLEGNGLTTGSGVLGSAPGIGYGVFGSSTSGRGVGGSGLIAGGVFTGTTNGQGAVGNAAGTGNGILGNAASAGAFTVGAAGNGVVGMASTAIQTGGGTSIGVIGVGQGGIGTVPTGDAVGVYAQGGSGGSSGLRAVGGPTGSGVLGIGGSTSGYGVEARGVGASSGVFGTGGGTAGYGGEFMGGATNGAGLLATGVGSGRGGYFIGGATGHGAEVLGGTASVSALKVSNAAGSGNDALESSGAISMVGTDPSTTDAIVKKIYPMSINKAWGHLTCTTGSNPTLTEGFCIASCTASGNDIVVNLAISFSSAARYIVIPIYSGTANTTNAVSLIVHSKGTAAFTVSGWNGGSAINLNATGFFLDFMVMGR